MELKYPILGIDVGKKHLDGCLLYQNGNRISTKVTNTQAGFQALLTWLERHRDGNADGHVTVCLEATNSYSAAVALTLYQHQMTVILANPAAVSAFMRAEMKRAKTDRADAVLIANFVRSMAHTLCPWQPLPAEYEELRDLVRQLRTMKRGHAKALHHRETLDFVTSAAKARIQRSINAELAFFKKEVRILTNDINACLRKHSQLRERFDLVTTVPGVGFATAVTYMSEVPDIGRFRHANQVAAFAGLTPRIRHSGDHKPVSQPISKMGNVRLREAFYMASLYARQHGTIKVCVQNHAAKKPMVMQIAAARKLLILLYAMEKNKMPFDQMYQKQQPKIGTN